MLVLDLVLQQQWYMKCLSTLITCWHLNLPNLEICKFIAYNLRNYESDLIVHAREERWFWTQSCSLHFILLPRTPRRERNPTVTLPSLDRCFAEKRHVRRLQVFVSTSARALLLQLSQWMFIYFSWHKVILILMALTRFLKPTIYGTHQDPWASYYQFIMLPLLPAVISGQLSPKTHVSDQLTSKSLSANLSLVKKNRGGDGSKVSAQSFSNTTMMPRTLHQQLQINAVTSNHMSCSTKNSATFRGEELQGSIWNGCLFDTNNRAPTHSDYCRMLKW